MLATIIAIAVAYFVSAEIAKGLAVSSPLDPEVNGSGELEALTVSDLSTLKSCTGRH